MDDLRATHWIACHTDSAYHHALHTIWFIFYVYSISGFCFSFWSSQVTPLAWKETWLTHVLYTLPVSWINTRTSAVFLFESILAVAPLCILNSILDRFNAHSTTSGQSRHSFEYIIRSNNQYNHCDMHWIREVSWKISICLECFEIWQTLHWFY